ncbi:hypothetical protein ACFX58_10900 [Sphingomonas sp. NCPPB 2930]
MADEAAQPTGSAAPGETATAQVRPNGFARPGPIGNTVGVVVPKTMPGPGAGGALPPKKTETEEERIEAEARPLLDKIREIEAHAKSRKDLAEASPLKERLEELAQQQEQRGGVKAGTALGDYRTGVFDKTVGAMAGAMAGMGGGRFGAGRSAGMAGKPPPVEPSPRAGPRVPPHEPPAPKPAGGGNNGGYIPRTGRRRPGRRCELVPHNELECPPGQDRHHVVPDFTYRTGARPKKGSDTAGRAPGAPTLDNGLAICLSDEEHKAAHREDKRFKGASDSTRGGAVAGTMTGQQAKTISASNVEKATGGKKGGGCSKQDLMDQLRKQTEDDAVLRGDKSLKAFNKRDGAAEAVAGRRRKK